MAASVSGPFFPTFPMILTFELPANVKNQDRYWMGDAENDIGMVMDIAGETSMENHHANSGKTRFQSMQKGSSNVGNSSYPWAE